MLYSFLIAAALLTVLAVKYLGKTAEKCPECGHPRQEDTPICACGWVFEYPEDDTPLEYGDPTDGPDFTGR